MDVQQQYRQFRAIHPLRSRMIDGAQWEYILCGEGQEVLLLLPGGFGAADTSFLYILAFEADYRVLSVTYPTTVTTVAALVDGLARLLAHEGIVRAHVLGGSYSGLVAQCFVRSYPELVASLILSHTSGPQPRRARLLEACHLLFHVAPMPLLRSVLRLMNRGFLPGNALEQRFWRAYFGAMIGALGREGYLNRFRVAIDVDRNYRFAPGDLDDWPGRLLIVEAEDDGFTRPGERAALRRLYPRAQHHAFSHGGHVQTVDRPDQQIALIRRFLAENAISGNQ